MFLDLIKKHKLTFIFSAAALVLLAIAVAGRMNKNIIPPASQNTAAVSLLRASDYRQARTIDLENGTVESLGQADLKAQISAPIAQVNVRLGDRVAAGQTLVQLQNNDTKAQLEQALAGLRSAQARLEELERGSRPEDIAVSQTSQEEARMALINSIKDAYAKSDDAIHNHIDKFFINPRQSSPVFGVEVNVSGAGKTVFKASDLELAANVQKKKYEIETILTDWRAAAAGLVDASTETELESVLALSEKNLKYEIDFLNDMAPLVNSLSTDSAAVKAAIDGYKTEFSAARGTVSGSLASLQSAQTAWLTASKSLEYKVAGSSVEQIEQGKASIAQAQASVDNFKAALAKTTIVSPIAGEISYINGNTGEYVSAGTLVAGVVNPGALRIKTYASENDLSEISQGAAVTIAGNAQGIVETIAPAVDSQTKKAEVNIIIVKNGDPKIVVGQNVGVKIAAKNSETGQYFLLPIEAIQFTGNETYALSVDDGSTLVKIPVVTGQIIGEKIYVVSGLQNDSSIVSSVRGLEAGQTVTVRN